MPIASYPRRQLYVAMVACAPLFLTGTAYAGPDGGVVTGGNGSITQQGSTTTIYQHSDLLTLNWKSYNLAPEDVVNYVQPGADATALNFILDHNPSRIEGQINANGRVVLVNPNGMVFSEGARINVGGLLASGLDLDTDDFIGGDVRLSALEGSEGAVINRGLIQAATGGSVALVGQRVRNEGIIEAKLGAVSLAAGREAVLTFDDAGLMGVRVTEAMLQDELGVEPGLVNTGDIQAAGGRVLLTASVSRDVFSQAVNTGDLQPARSVVFNDDGSYTLGGGADLVNSGRVDVSGDHQAGQITLLGESITHTGELLADTQSLGAGRIELHAQGTLSAREQSLISAESDAEGRGGAVLLLGDRVGLFDSARVSVDGAQGGGYIFLGGDYQGSNPFMPNATQALIAPEARIAANAHRDGDGGRVIIWADDSTRFYGDLSAQGAGTGTGGFSEVSGKERLGFWGTADLSGPVGGGTLLLDPRDIDIEAVGGPIPSPVDDFDGETPVDYVISVEALEAALAGAADVLLQARRNINFNADVSQSNAAGSLTLEAGYSVNFNAILDVGAASLIVHAGAAACGGAVCEDSTGTDRTISVGTLGAEISTTGNIHFNAIDDIIIQSGIESSALSLYAGDSLEIALADPSTRINADTLTANANQITLDGTLGVDGDLSLSALDTLTLNSDLSVGSEHILLSAGNEMHLGNINAQGDLLLSGLDGTPTVNTQSDTGLSVAGQLILNNLGEVSLRSFADIDIQVDGPLGSINVDARGRSDEAGFNISLAVGEGFSPDDALVIAGLDSSGTSPTSNGWGNSQPGHRAGDISITAANVHLAGNILARSRASDQEGGVLPGKIEINGHLHLLGDHTLSALDENHLSHAGGIEFTGAITGEDDATLTLAGRDLNFGGMVGSDGLAEVIVEATHSVSFEAGGIASGQAMVLTGVGDHSERTLVAGNQENTWAIRPLVESEPPDDPDAPVPPPQPGAEDTLNGSVRFSGFSQLVGGEQSDHFTLYEAVSDYHFDGGGGSNQLSHELTTEGHWRISDNGEHTLTFGDEVVTFTGIGTLVGRWRDHLYAPNQHNTWVLPSWTTVGTLTNDQLGELSFRGMGSLIGGNQNDDFSAPNGLDEFVLVDGGEGNNSLSAPEELGNTWALWEDSDDPDGYTGSLTSRYGWIDAFRGIQTLYAGGRHDTFNLETAVDGLSIHGAGQAEVNVGPGVGSLAIGVGGMLSADETTLDRLAIYDVSVLWINGSGDQSYHLHNLHDRDNHWLIDGPDSGWLSALDPNTHEVDSNETELRFSGITHLYGGTGDDHFHVLDAGALSGVVYGGGGNNRLDLSQRSDSINIELGGDDPSVDGIRIEGIQTLIGNASADTDGITSALTGYGYGGGGATWRIDTLNGGEYRPEGGETLYFSQFNALFGTNGNDTFEFIGDGYITGHIDGRGGRNIYNAQAAGMAHSVSFDAPGEWVFLANIHELSAPADRSNAVYGSSVGNDWAITGPGVGTVTPGDTEDTVEFDGFNRLWGGAGDDHFTLSGAAQLHSIHGQGGENTLILDQTLNEALAVSLDADIPGAVYVTGLHSVTAEGDTVHRLVGANQDNHWLIDGAQTGTLNSQLRFTGFDHLVGNDHNDEFELITDDALIQVIDGGGSGNNTLTLEGLSEQQLTLSLAERGEAAADIYLQGIQTIDAPESAEHRLRAANTDNQWSLTDHNQGTLNDVTFTGIGTLLGGAGEDSFEFRRGSGLSGYIDGTSEQGNRLDVSALEGFTLIYGDEGTARRIQHLVGNDRDTRLVGGDGFNEWTLTAGRNQGDLNGNLSFQGVAELQGGNQGNHFTINGGRVSGEIVGGLGDDTFEVTIAPGVQGRLRLRGGDGGNNRLTTLGDGRGYQAEYRPGDNAAQALVYTRDDEHYEIVYSGLSEVTDDRQNDWLVLGSPVGANNLSLGDNRYQVDSHTPLNWRGTTNVRIDANRQDTLSLAGHVDVPGTLEIRHADIEQADDSALLEANHLRLVDVAQFGRPDQPIDTDISNLSAQTVGEVYLRDIGSMRIQLFEVDGLAQLSVRGNLHTEAPLRAGNNLTLESRQGDLQIGGDHRIAGALSVFAPEGQVDLTGLARDLVIDRVEAEHLNLSSSANLVAEGRVQLDRLTITEAGQVSLLNEDNRIRRLRADNLDSLVLHTESDLTADAVRVNEYLELSSAGDLTLAALSADERISLRTGREIRGAGNADVHLRTPQLRLDSQEGIGRDDRLRLAVSELHALNRTGRVALENTGDLTIERLGNNGTISLRNTGDVSLNGQGGPVFDRSATDAIAMGGTVNAHNGLLNLTVTNGDLTATGQFNAEQPDLSASNASIIVGGAIGAPNRPLSIWVTNDLFVQGIRSWPLVWAFGEPPATVDNQSTIQVNQQDLLRTGGEQMVEVESLVDIDPAVFGAVRNYTYDRVSILLPPSQRFDDDEWESY